ncbi:Nuclear transport factor 2 [Grifola frondosa]|uniref:Nuclear transport factor 2 n=1 Tax=Grifola frondosa TaxID=5627 RepID=A0A1C7MG53_GRIFR|nr:Nuclear transport factor 2 [Grifola frondosa]
MADINSIAKQFTDFYYSTFDTNRSGLQSLYRDSSMLSFEGAQFLGAAPISEKLTTLPFEKVLHKVTTLDAQPSSPTVASLIVSVTGFWWLMTAQIHCSSARFSSLYLRAGVTTYTMISSVSTMARKLS